MSRTISATGRPAVTPWAPSSDPAERGTTEPTGTNPPRSNELLGKTSNNFRTYLLGVLALGLFTLAFWPAFSELLHLWMSSEDYSHAPITIPVIFFMFWAERNKLARLYHRYAPAGLVLVVISTTLYLFALLTQVNTLIFLSTYLSIIGITVYVGGPGAVKTLATPLLLLLLLIPVPQQLYAQATFPLQLIVSRASEAIVLLLDVPLFREGNVMRLPQKTLEVVEACSGLRSILILLSLSVIMGYFLLHRFRSKAFLFVASIPTAILVNILRIVSMILMFHFFNLDLTTGPTHSAAGILVLLTAIFILFMLQRILKRLEI